MRTKKLKRDEVNGLVAAAVFSALGMSDYESDSLEGQDDRLEFLDEALDYLATQAKGEHDQEARKDAEPKP